MLLGLLAATVLAAAPQPALHLKPCVLQTSVQARCGTLVVPEDRAHPLARTTRIFVGVVPAYGSGRHAEPIFWLSGGPGGAAAEDDARFASSTFLTANKTRDIVLVDQRGVGRSTPLVCPPPPVFVDEAGVAAYARSCVSSLGRDPRLYTTDAAMDDVDAVRKALGYGKIVLYGGSYGATAAQVYLARHGSHVAAAVLDGATLLDVPIWERMPVSTQSAFDALTRRCAADTRCHAAFPDPAADLSAALARLRAAPIAVGAATFGPADLQGTLRLLLRVPEWAAQVPALLRLAAAGTFDPLVQREQAASDAATARKLMYWAIRCGEGWSRDDPAEVQRLGVGTSFLESALADAQSQAVVCGALGETLGPPLAAPDTGVVPRSSVPVLFLVGGMDPQDPLANVAAARRSLTNARILVVPGAGHGALQVGCLANVAARFFTAHRLSTVDRTCAAATKPPPFLTNVAL